MTADPLPAWTNFLAALDTVDPVLGAAALRTGAAAGQLSQVVAVFGGQVPAAAQGLYTRHDGEAGQGFLGAWLGWRFLPLAEVEAALLEWRSELAAGYIERATPADQRMGEEFPSLTHWPLCADGNGNWLVLDGGPGPAGTPGQVLHVGADLLDGEVVCRDLDTLFREGAALLRGGRYTRHTDPQMSNRLWLRPVADGNAVWGRL